MIVLDLAFYVVTEEIGGTLDVISLQNHDHSGIRAISVHALACDAFTDALSGVLRLEVAPHDLSDNELALRNVEVVFFHI